MYAVIFIDAINVKIREGQVANRPVYLALGVTVDGERDVLGLWAGEHGDGEGAKYWLRVCSEIKNRGVRDVCMLVCDGLKGLPERSQPPGFSFIGDYGREFLRILLTWGFAACAGMMVLSGVHPAGAGRRKAGPEQRAGVGLCLVPACGRRRAPWFWEITGYHTMQSPDLERSSPCRICRGITG